MVSVISLVIIIAVSILITRIATLALVHTGLSKQTAKFQARSAFTGVGFTTREAERIVSHPVRRRIIMVLMLLGNVGVISVLASVVLTFIDVEIGAGNWVFKILALIGGLGALWYFSSSALVDKWLSHFIDHLLKKYTDLEVRDYAGLLHLSGEYEISEMIVDADNWMLNKSLIELKLRSEGINLLGIEREDGTYIGSPNGETQILEGDLLILYGRASAIKQLNDRRKGVHGVVEHNQAVAEQKVINTQENKLTENQEE